jgi:two-component system, OmpR family, alkaline phosphatase synthesis response regulator PhoP
VAKILVVEDDPAVRDVVEHALSREGMETATVENGEEALERLRGEPFDLVVLDVMLPGIDGISVCRELRADGENGDIPVVMLTARDDEINVVVGLEVDADDYVTKPFSPRELVSRVRAHLRRRSLDARKAEASSTAEKRLEFPGLTVDLLRRQVVLGGKEVELTAREFDVLALLASHPGRVYSREQIMRHLWDGDFFGEARAADVHIQHIRHKVEPDPKNPRYVRTVRGAGYRFAEF